jgi:hypothetical protein
MNKVSYLILDFNKPTESSLCLQSLRENTKFDCPIIYLSNGGHQDYVWEFYKKGWIDKLVVNKENTGLGFGTQDLFKICDSEYAIYVQNDQYLGREYTEAELDQQIEKLGQDGKIQSISLAGDQCQGKYSERAHLINSIFYRRVLLPKLTGGGAGPYHHLEWAEETIQKFYEENNLKHYIWPQVLFGDNGAWSIRTNPDGSLWRNRTDIKTAYLVQGPVKEKYVYPPFSDEQWETILKEQKCEAIVPDGWKDNVFKCWL